MKKDTKVPVKLLGLKIIRDMDSLEVFGLLSSDLTNIANYVVTNRLRHCNRLQSYIQQNDCSGEDQLYLDHRCLL